MIERDPLSTGGTWSRARVQRSARLLSLRVRAIEEELIERQLRELDDAIVGTSAEELRALREWSDVMARVAWERGQAPRQP